MFISPIKVVQYVFKSNWVDKDGDDENEEVEHRIGDNGFGICLRIVVVGVFLGSKRCGGDGSKIEKNIVFVSVAVALFFCQLLLFLYFLFVWLCNIYYLSMWELEWRLFLVLSHDVRNSGRKERYCE